MPKKSNFFISIILLSLLIFAGGCAKKEEARKELLIYCGITMILPISEIARIIEHKENCKIIITKGGSGNLLNSIRTNKMGDLFLPGSDSYIEKAEEEGLVVEDVFVGHNKAALFVQKGNPKNISANLENLAKKEYYVVIGNPDSGSIGKETEQILKKKEILDEVLVNARMLTTDSKDLINVLKDKQADLVVNWYAASQWPENKPLVETLPISEQYAKKKKLVLGLLNTSRYPEIARAFMKYAASEKGRTIFKKHGLYID